MYYYVSWLISCLVHSLIIWLFPQHRAILSTVHSHILTLQILSVDFIVQWVLYKTFDFHHHLLPLLLACLILVHVTQNHN